jgi:hypothetical protein
MGSLYSVPAVLAREEEARLVGSSSAMRSNKGPKSFLLHCEILLKCHLQTISTLPFMKFLHFRGSPSVNPTLLQEEIISPFGKSAMTKRWGL